MASEKPKFHSVKAAAQAKAIVQNDAKKKPKNPKPITVELTTLGGYKAWAAQQPAVASTLALIVGKWRGSGATVRGRAGKWAAWDQRQWAGWAKVSVATFKRRLDHLQAADLIEREQHRFGGTAPLAFLRPTVRALVIMGGGKGSDFVRLSQERPDAIDPAIIAMIEAYRYAFAHFTKSFEKGDNIQGHDEVELTDHDRLALEKLLSTFGKDAVLVIQTITYRWKEFTAFVMDFSGSGIGSQTPKLTVMAKHLHAAREYILPFKDGTKSVNAPLPGKAANTSKKAQTGTL